MDDVLKKKAAELRAMGVKQNIPLLVEVLDGLTGCIGELMKHQDKVLALAAEEQTAEHNHQAVLTAIKSLSFSELEAIKQILQSDELKSGKGILVCSLIADQLGITRSVIVNGLRKLESAGILSSRSLGMKGTHIKMLIPEFRQVIHAN